MTLKSRLEKLSDPPPPCTLRASGGRPTCRRKSGNVPWNCWPTAVPKPGRRFTPPLSPASRPAAVCRSIRFVLAIVNADLRPLLADALTAGHGVGLEDFGHMGQHRQVLDLAGGNRVAEQSRPAASFTARASRSIMPGARCRRTDICNRHPSARFAASVAKPSRNSTLDILTRIIHRL